jgi:hypothetical protein
MDEIALFVQKNSHVIVNLTWAAAMLMFSYFQLRSLYADKRKRKLATIEANRIKTPAEVLAAYAAEQATRTIKPSDLRKN